MPPGTPAKTPKTYKAGAAMFERRRLEQQQAAMMVQLRQPLENREAETVGPAVAASEEILASTTASIAALAEKEAALNAREALLDARERELSPRSPGGAKQDARAAYAAEQRRALRHKPGGLLDESQSRAILLLYFHLVEMHKRPDKSVEEVATVFGIGKSKVYSVSTRQGADVKVLLVHQVLMHFLGGGLAKLRYTWILFTKIRYILQTSTKHTPGALLLAWLTSQLILARKARYT